MHMIDYLQIINEYESLFGQNSSLKNLKTQIKNWENIIDRKNMNGHIVCSPFVFTTDFSKLLCIYHKTQQRYQQPWEHIDDMVSHPFVHGMRELEEETWLQIARIHDRHLNNNLCPINIDSHIIPSRPEKNEWEHIHHDIQFICIADETIVWTDDKGVNDAHRECIENLSDEMKQRVKIVKERLWI